MAKWSPFASAVTKTLDIPDGDGEQISIRKLGWKELERAATLMQKASAELLVSLGGVAVLREMQALGGEQAVRDARAGDPILGYDRLELIATGVVRWPDGLQPTRAQLEQLEPVFAEWLSRQIWELSNPAPVAG